MKTVFLLHGHSSWDTGATNIISSESDAVAKICSNVYLGTRHLENTRVVLVPRKKSLTELCETINQLSTNVPNPYVIEVHLNAASDPNTDRIETICYSGSTAGKALAETALKHMQIIKGTSKNDRVLLRNKNEDGGYLCYRVKPVAILTEYCFMSNNKYKTTDSFNKMCDDYAKSLINLIKEL